MNNAGFVLGVEQIGQIADDDYESMFNVNVLGLIRVTQLLVKGMFETHTPEVTCSKSI